MDSETPQSKQHGYTKYAICTTCNQRRTHLKNSQGEPLCEKCRLKDRVCARCGKSLPRASRVQADGSALCAPCSVHYREPNPCPVCGQLSQRLSRCIRLGHVEQQVCERCYRKGNINCVICGKNRLQGGLRVDGRPLCKLCYERQGQAFICKVCGLEGIPHSINSCQDCYWKAYAEKRFKNSLNLLTNPWCKHAYTQFFKSLIKKQRAQTVGLKTLERYFLFFAKLDVAFDNPQKITAEFLIDNLGSNGLFRNNVPYSFLVKEKLIPEIENDALHIAKQKKRQNNMLLEADGAWYGPVLRRFHNYMEFVAKRCLERGWTGSRARFIPSTITSALIATTFLLKYLTQKQITSLQQFDQVILDQFLTEDTGYKAGIHSFIRYLNHKEKLFQKLIIVHPPKYLPEDVFIPTNKFNELLARWFGAEGVDLRDAVICILMSIYAQKISNIVKIKLTDIALNDNGRYTVKVGVVQITLVDRVSSVLEKYLSQRDTLATLDDARTNIYLFPGRNYGSHLIENSVSYCLEKHGVKANQLFAMALFSAYKRGLKHPKVLVKAFGISVTCAMKYFELINTKFMSEINEVVKA